MFFFSCCKIFGKIWAYIFDNVDQPPPPPKLPEKLVENTQKYLFVTYISKNKLTNAITSEFNPLNHETIRKVEMETAILLKLVVTLTKCNFCMLLMTSTGS